MAARRLLAPAVAVVLVFVPIPAWAQATGSIAGLVTDTTGGVLPGVTVEASSPALIEQVRNVVTNAEGRYEIEGLRSGTYAIDFSLPGFSVFRREGVELTAGFTASINAQLSVGSLEETVTVTGASPQVDTQNVIQQAVLSAELLSALPTSTKSAAAYVALIPGLVATGDVGGSGGLMNASALWRSQYHGKASVNHRFEGTSFETQHNTLSWIANPYNVEEVTVQTGGVSADTDSSGVVIDMIPKEGGNLLSGLVHGNFGNDSMQSNNLTDDLRARGITTTNEAIRIYDTALSVGGPIRRDKVWFYATGRLSGSKINVPGIFFNATQGDPCLCYTPDMNRPAYRQEWLKSGAVRLTWQASERNKVSFYNETQSFLFRGSGNFASPEASSAWNFSPMSLIQVRWSNPVTNRLLLEATYAYNHNPFPFPTGGDHFMRVSPDDISVRELSTGFRYNAKSSYNDTWLNFRQVQRFSLSYVTGSHAFKTGVQMQQGGENLGRNVNQDVTYDFFNGVPQRLTMSATPFVREMRVSPEIGLFVQDQWTIRRLTLDLGLRYDYWNGSVPPQTIPAGRFLPARSFDPVGNVPNYHDINPRLGAAYDLFGDGRTALKVSLGRYVQKANIDIPASQNPIRTSVNTVVRTWNDANANLVPNCDLLNPNANGECGPFSNRNFGQLNIRTRFADDVFQGWGHRLALWDFSAEVEHQLRPGLSVTAGYFRNWAGNFTATDNLEVGPADFDPYCVTAPLDPRLPGGGGNEVCGLYDVTPAKYGLSDNLVSQASNFYPADHSVTCNSSPSTSGLAGTLLRFVGRYCGTSDFFNVTIDGRFDSGVQIGGGVDTGRTVMDNCFVVDSPQQLFNCRATIPFGAQTQVKLHASYPLPYDFTVSAIFQNIGGPGIEANWSAPNSEISPSLGRDLAACRGAAVCSARVTIPIIEPYTEWEDRRNQIDMRITKRFAVGSGGAFLRANLDIYNLLNGSSILGVNHRYSPSSAAWLRPIAVLNTEAYLAGRFIQVSGDFEF